VGPKIPEGAARTNRRGLKGHAGFRYQRPCPAALDHIARAKASARGGHVGRELRGDRVILTSGCVTVIEGAFLIGR
jgi:hypothetical protein